MSKKKELNEVGAISRFVDKFFQSILDRTADRFLKQAKGKGVNDING